MSRGHPCALAPGPAADCSELAAGGPLRANRQQAGEADPRQGAIHSNMKNPPPAGNGARKITLRRLLPLLVLLIGLGLFFVLDLDQYLNWKELQKHQDWLLNEVAENGLLANVVFIAIYAVATAFSIPGGLLLTIVGGFLFGTVAATISVIIGATVGAVCLFLAARYALFDVLHAKAGPALLKMEQGFKENALNYLLVLRLVPLFPFWLVNLVPALLDVPLKTYVVATAIGIIPGTFVYASVGNGLGQILASGGRPDVSLIYDPDILIPLLGLAVLALVPVLYKAWKGRQDTNANND
jgi:uncharacterized membrane protein YdjX (TVP38/TMEM64 family)